MRELNELNSEAVPQNFPDNAGNGLEKNQAMSWMRKFVRKNVF
ncbi:hypothetical protein [Erwinia aphidicola]